LFGKAPLFDDWPSESRGIVLGFWRALFVTLVLLPLVRKPRWRPMLVPLATAFSCMNGTYLTSVVLTTAANAIWLQNTAPFWVLLIGTLVFREPIFGRDLLPVVLAALGVGLILYFELQGAWTGVVCGMASGLFYSTVVCCMRQLREEDGPWLVALCNGTAALVFFPVVVWLNYWPDFWQLLVLFAFGTFQMAIPYVCLVRGLRYISGQEAATIGLIEPVLLPVWVYVAYRQEIPAWWTIAGGGLILVGLVVRYVVLEPRPAADEMVPKPVGVPGE
jgi:drug/metabolite transporter (DMT)-like permease